MTWAAAARELDTLRNNWLNPPEWTRTEVLEFPGLTDGPWRRYIDPETVRPLAGQNVPRQSRGLTGGMDYDAPGASQRPSNPRPTRHPAQPAAGCPRGLTDPGNRDADSPIVAAPGSAGGSVGIGTVRYPRIVARDEECAKQLKKRTLTNLYNERPTWLDLAHKKLDAAVFAAYGWDPAMSDEELLAALLELNLARAAAQ